MAESYDQGLKVEAGRYISHPPEPPHLIMMWYKAEQKQLINEFKEANPGTSPKAVEKWVELDADGNWVAREGVSPTPAQILHAGTLKKELPLVGYAPWENHFYLGIAFSVLLAIFIVAAAPIRANSRKAMRAPGRFQMFAEMVTGAFDQFCKGLLGEENGRRYMPYIATLFCLILICNFMGMIPTMRAPSASIIITLSFALCTFLVVQFTAWTKLGPLTYLHHLAGSPKDAIGWALSPLFLLLEIISDFIAKPLSLALRLFGNIFGKDILLGAFLGMGITLMAVIAGPVGDYVGIPLTVPFYFLGLLLSTIQALVFSLLSVIYIMLVLPHDHDHHEDVGEEMLGRAPAVPEGGAKAPIHEALPG